jgi:Uma2 family endonuclease
MEEPTMGRTVAQGAYKLTYEDFLHFPDDGKRHEIVDGEHFVTPSPSVRHQRVLRRLYDVVGRFVEERGLGEVFFAPLDVVLSDHDVVEPDLLFVSAAQQAILTAANVRGAPELVVEVLSPASRRLDEVLKQRAYERTGIVEYWVVDPEAETVKVFRREGESFARPLLLSAAREDTLTSPLLPGLEIRLAALLAE